MNAEQIQQIIVERVTAWKNGTPGIWSWPHDTFMNEPWGYAVHAASVAAWNFEDERQTECATFLLKWATIENIKAALLADGKW